MTIPYEGPFEWRNGCVLWRCGDCGQYSVTSYTSPAPMWVVRVHQAICSECGARSPIKTSAEWQGIEQEARNLMYA